MKKIRGKNEKERTVKERGDANLVAVIVSEVTSADVFCESIFAHSTARQEGRLGEGLCVCVCVCVKVRARCTIC